MHERTTKTLCKLGFQCGQQSSQAAIKIKDDRFQRYPENLGCFV